MKTYGEQSGDTYALSSMTPSLANTFILGVFIMGLFQPTSFQPKCQTKS